MCSDDSKGDGGPHEEYRQRHSDTSDADLHIESQHGFGFHCWPFLSAPPTVSSQLVLEFCYQQTFAVIAISPGAYDFSSGSSGMIG